MQLLIPDLPSRGGYCLTVVFQFRASGRLYRVFSPTGFDSKEGYEKDLYISPRKSATVIQGSALKGSSQSCIRSLSDSLVHWKCLALVIIRLMSG